MANEEEKKEKKTKTEYVTKEYFDEQFNKILNLVEKVVVKTPAEEKEQEEVKSSESNKTPIPPDWSTYIDNHLGKEVGRSVFYPKSGGVILQISIPRELSNASEDQWKFYKHDFRTKSIDAREGFEGVKKYVDLVAKNLKLDIREVAEKNRQIK